MSMNLCLEARLPAETALGPRIIIEYFDLWQTPTEVTYHCLDQPDPCTAYVEWVESFYKREPGPGCSQETIDINRGAGEAHLNYLKHWLEKHEGWEIEWYYL